MSGYAPDAAFACSREAFAQAEEWLLGPESAGLEHAELEEQLEARGREIQRRLLQDHLDLRAARERRREQVTGPDGVVRTRAEAAHTRSLASVFGPVIVSRIAYRAPGARNVHPADAELNLPRGKYSHGLSKRVARAAARGSFEQACADVVGQTGRTSVLCVDGNGRVMAGDEHGALPGVTLRLQSLQLGGQELQLLVTDGVVTALR